MNRKICVITGSRAEYGLLKPLLEEINADRELQLLLVVTGMHLSPEFGATYKDIEQDTFVIDEKVDISLSADTPLGIAKSMGIAIEKMAGVYQKLKPDIITILGDRFEIFSAVAAALISGIPVAHIHGGELSEGCIDDSFRHCITKMSHLHFAAAEEYRRRIIQLGEQPRRVFNVGALGIEAIRKLEMLSKEQIEKELGIKFNRYNLLVTFHPATLEQNPEEQFKILLNVLDELKDTTLIFTKANADMGGRIINKMIDDYVVNNPGKAKTFASLGQRRYISTMNYVDAVVGNSSSGIIEAPTLKVATVNIGDRQRGRVSAASVVNCRVDREDIKKTISYVYSAEFKQNLKNVVNPYDKCDTASAIKNIIKGYALTGIIKKKFQDLENLDICEKNLLCD